MVSTKIAFCRDTGEAAKTQVWKIKKGKGFFQGRILRGRGGTIRKLQGSRGREREKSGLGALSKLFVTMTGKAWGKREYYSTIA